MNEEVYNENRITRMQILLFGIKRAFPYLRFGQIISGACEAKWGNVDVFYVRDDDMILALEKYWKTLGGDANG